MAKTPRKGQPFRQKAVRTAPAVSSKSANPHQYGGKNFKNLQNPIARNRRFSLTESTSSDSSEGLARQSKPADHLNLNSDSESSLTALSEQEENQSAGKSVSRYSGLSFASKRGKHSTATKSRSAKSTKSVRKRVSAKSHYLDAAASEDDSTSENEDDGEDDDDDDNEENFALGLYSMIGTNERNSSDSESSDDSQDNGNESSSSDDSEVDFLVLQAEQRMNNLKAIKGLPGKAALSNAKAKNRRRSTALRKRSEVALPEDINFRFEFDQSRHENVFEDSEDELKSSQMDSKSQERKDEEEEEEEEEDIGEEVQDNNSRPDFEFNFDEPLIDVPKIKEEDLISDDDYEFDDNDLLATLQAENDVDEFLTSEPNEKIRTRQSSMSSFNDETEDPFLKEEEKFLVNEFEINGFDDEEAGPNTTETARVMDSFNMTGSQSDKVIQYASSSEDASESDFEDLKLDFEDEDNDLDDYIDFIDNDVPTASNATRKDDKVSIVGNRKKDRKEAIPKKRGKRRGPLDSEEEDDSYLWNYFFSSDAESDAENNDLDNYDVEEQLLLEEVFRKDFEEKQKQLGLDEVSINVQDSQFDAGYESGESTDIDLSLPSSGLSNKLGSKLAKEVLSSRTADYRPPILGTWVAIDSKPFSIIDGLSTRTLTSNQFTQRNPRTKNWKSFSLNHDSDDLAIDLEELLNVSELDNDDENDVRIWRDFNNNKKHVPLGAFRNKSKMHHPLVTEPLSGYNVSKMNTGVTGRRTLQVRAKLAAQRELESQSNANLVKELNMPSKLRRRRASIADAVSEGYRPTKSGLFSENVLADVEEVMGDDRDFMALIKGL